MDMCGDTHILNIYICIHPDIYIYIYKHTQYTRTPLSGYVCAYAYAHAYALTYAHTHTYTLVNVGNLNRVCLDQEKKI